MGRKSTLYYVLLLLVLSCGKEFSSEGNGNGNQSSLEDTIIYKSTWEFKEGSSHYQGPVDTAFLTKENGNQVLTINGKTITGSEKLTIVLTSPGAIKKGSYATNQFQVKFLYTTVDDTIFSARPYFGGDMLVTITEIDDRHVTGTFRGIALDRTKKDKEIIEGKFVSPLKKGSGSGTGGVILWASESCNGPIKVKVNNLPGEITAFPFVTPDCGEAGSASFTLQQGSYRWVAYCTTDSISGIVNVAADSCSKIKIIFPFKPAPVTHTSDDSCVVETIRVRIGENTNVISAEFLSDRVETIYFDVDVYKKIFVYTKHYFEYAANTINILDGRHQFILDPAGRVLQYNGLLEPNVFWQAQKIISNYYYDKGYLYEVRVIKDDGTPFRTVKLDWENGNIKTIKADYLVGGGSDEIYVDYYADKNIKAFPYIFSDIPELFFFQSGINTGPSIKYAIKTRRMKSYDRYGKLISDNTWTYDNYIIDANNYIQSLSLHHSSPFDPGIHYSFTYHCF